MSTKNQAGSIHTIVIIVLVVVVLGLLGFVFWQNFINKPTNTVTPTGNDVTTIRTLKIAEWGVQGDYTDTSVDFVSVVDSSSGTDMVNLTDSKLGSVSGCEGDHAAGYISRLSGDTKITSDGLTASQRYDDFVKTGLDNSGYFAMAHVGSYYYLYTSPQSNCSSDTAIADIQQAASLSAAQVVKTLRQTN